MVKRTPKLIGRALIIGLLYMNTWAESTSEPRLVSLDLSFYQPFRPSAPQLFFQLAEEYVPVQFPRTMRGEVIPYEGPEKIVFYTRYQSDLEEIEYRPVTTALLSKDLKAPLLVFHVNKGDGEDLEIRVIVMEVAQSHFPRGSICMVNMTNISMHGMIGEQRMIVQPGVSSPFSFAANGALRVGLAFEFEGETYPSFLNTVTLDSATRQWMFIGKPRRPGSSRVQVRFVEDHAMLGHDAEK